MFIAIDNDPRPYAWGSTTALSSLLGRVPSGGPEAELWLGTHPVSPSFIVGRTDRPSLADVLATRGERPLPFLLKVLAAATPLSLQVHPNTKQARAGCDRENAAGIPLDAPWRNYRDPGAKPELIMAVGEFEALSGFRPAVQSVTCLRELARLARQAGDDHGALAVAAWADALETDGRRAALADALSGSPQARLATKAIVGIASRLEDSEGGVVARDLDTVRRISAAFGADPGILTALLLNRVTLRDGEALFLDAGNLHAYLSGLGIEIMGASDNVLRGGLTTKHVDVAEVLAVTRDEVLDNPLWPPTEAGLGVRVFRPPVADFALYDIDDPSRQSTHLVALDAAGPGIALGLRGGLTLEGATSAYSLSRGQAVFISAEEYPVSVRGSGRMVMATPGLAGVPHGQNL